MLPTSIRLPQFVASDYFPSFLPMAPTSLLLSLHRPDPDPRDRLVVSSLNGRIGVMYDVSRPWEETAGIGMV